VQVPLQINLVINCFGAKGQYSALYRPFVAVQQVAGHWRAMDQSVQIWLYYLAVSLLVRAAIAVLAL
jgi:hypothetical protein